MFEGLRVKSAMRFFGVCIVLFVFLYRSKPTLIIVLSIIINIFAALNLKKCNSMKRGKQTCKILKEIRKQIAEENDIELVISECTYQAIAKVPVPSVKPRCDIWSTNWRDASVWARLRFLLE